MKKNQFYKIILLPIENRLIQELVRLSIKQQSEKGNHLNLKQLKI